MSILNRDIKVPSLWQIYFFLLISTSILLAVVSYFRWETIKKENWLELSYIHRLITHSVEDRFQQQASMLKMLGNRLLEIDIEKNHDEAQVLLNNFLNENPVFAAYGLALPNGKLVLTSQNLHNRSLPNLKNHPDSANSFNKALKSKGIYLGRTYFFKPLNEWIIPLRYAIRDKNNTVLAVMTTGILLNGNYNPWKFSDMPDGIYIGVTKDAIGNSGFYSQYSNPMLYENDFIKTYQTQYPKAFIDQVEMNIMKSSGMNIESIRKSEKVVSYVGQEPAFGTFYETISYDKKLHLFTSVGRFQDYVIKRFIPIFISHAVAFVLFNLIAFLLFRYIARVQAKIAQQLHYKAMHDQLTGLPNRYFLSKEFENWRIKHPNFALLYLDLNNFKLINDHYGHSIGDKMLLKVSERLKACYNEGVLVIRYGGDEFILLYPNADISTINKFITHCNYQLNETMEIQSMSFTINGSFGIAMADTPQDSLESLLSHADLAMHKAKQKHELYALYTTELLEVSVEQAEIERHMQNALKNNEFYLVYQPQVNSRTQEVVGVEALLRWENEALGFITPDVFIPIAERSGFINELGDFVIDTALGEMASIKQATPLRLSINVSVMQLLVSSFANYLNNSTEKYGVDRKNIVIEITESLFIEDVKRMKFLLEQLQSEGYSISLDDFGTGYSSLSTLSKMPISELKIDKSFVDDILVDPHDRALIKSIISIGASLKISILAEGVEEEEQASMLKEFGCDLFQGYHYARPMRKEQLEEFLETFSR